MFAININDYQQPLSHYVFVRVCLQLLSPTNISIINIKPTDETISIIHSPLLLHLATIEHSLISQYTVSVYPIPVLTHYQPVTNLFTVINQRDQPAWNFGLVHHYHPWFFHYEPLATIISHYNSPWSLINRYQPLSALTSHYFRII